MSPSPPHHEESNESITTPPQGEQWVHHHPTVRDCSKALSAPSCAQFLKGRLFHGCVLRMVFLRAKNLTHLCFIDTAYTYLPCDMFRKLYQHILILRNLRINCTPQSIIYTFKINNLCKNTVSIALAQTLAPTIVILLIAFISLGVNINIFNWKECWYTWLQGLKLKNSQLQYIFIPKSLK